MVLPNFRIGVTGAAGRVARELIPRLSSAGHYLRLSDRAEVPSELAALAEVVERVDLGDCGRHAQLFDTCDIVIHLGGVAMEHDWSTIVAANITGTRNVLQAAVDASVGTVIIGSSIHAAGMLSVAQVAAAQVDAVAPDGYYGVSKIASEALGSLYATRFGLRVISVRICTFGAQPEPGRGHATWLAPDDLVRLVEASASAPHGHHVVWGVSNNSAAWFPLAAGRRIGYAPVEDAAAFPDGAPLPSRHALIGGVVTGDGYPVGQPW